VVVAVLPLYAHPYALSSSLLAEDGTVTVSCLVAQWLGHWIRDREVASSTPGSCVSE